MAAIPDVTFAEFLNYLVEGNDATDIIKIIGTEFEKVIDGSMTLKDFLDITAET